MTASVLRMAQQGGNDGRLLGIAALVCAADGDARYAARNRTGRNGGVKSQKRKVENKMSFSASVWLLPAPGSEQLEVLAPGERRAKTRLPLPVSVPSHQVLADKLAVLAKHPFNATTHGQTLM